MVFNVKILTKIRMLPSKSNHLSGIIYRDLKLENILLQIDGHVIKHPHLKRRKSRSQPPRTFVAEPSTQSNSFVGTEEYISPEIITGVGHSSAIDWWAVGILLYEMLYGRTPFRGKNRQKTFADAVESPLCPESLTSQYQCSLSSPPPTLWSSLSKS
uniref:non-specific serine/threonine protein kinase n=1 Tax=Lactuca sativa TaxID=4236 RepID=A0A9R1V5Q0_LACSA|nr:hypothetical protein LSAT_V11C600316410 [Lactuca sativa]